MKAIATAPLVRVDMQYLPRGKYLVAEIQAAWPRDNETAATQTAAAYPLRRIGAG
jgi:hypothetical protein